MVSKSNYNVVVNTNPSDCNVKVVNDAGMTIFSGKSPCFLNLNSSDGFFNPSHYTFNVSKDGYGEQSFKLGAGIDPWYAVGNIFFGGIIGWFIIDSLTGSVWKLRSNLVFNLTEKVV